MQNEEQEDREADLRSRIIRYLNLRDIYCLIVVSRSETFSEAAERCVISQPALSIKIRKVERLLQVTIFDRGHRRLTVTPAGEALVQCAEDIYRDLCVLNDLVQQEHDEQE